MLPISIPIPIPISTTDNGQPKTDNGQPATFNLQPATFNPQLFTVADEIRVRFHARMRPATGLSPDPACANA